MDKRLNLLGGSLLGFLPQETVTLVTLLISFGIQFPAVGPLGQSLP